MATTPLRLEERKPNLVRAWFDTVIRPLLSGLEEEHRRLGSLKWGWESQPPLLRATALLRDYLDSRAWKNMEQLLELYPEIRSPVEDHDGRAQKLLDAFSRLQEMIEASAELKCTYEEVTAELRSDLPLAERAPKYLAEYIANGHESLYRHYALADVWSEYSSRFLALRRLPEIAQQIRQIERAGSEQLEIVMDLERRLDELWRRLSIEHDVPLFPTEEAIPSR